MTFSMILALDINNLIGDSSKKFGLPWHYPEDLAFYKEKTINKKNIMGRKTFDQIQKALPNRETFILTRNSDLHVKGANTIVNIDDIFPLCKENEEVMVVGGVEVFELLMPLIDTIYLTRVNKAYTGDRYYNDFDLTNFKLVDTVNGEDKDLTFETWVRK